MPAPTLSKRSATAVGALAGIGCADIQTANATVHVIDAVLTPSSRVGGRIRSDPPAVAERTTTMGSPLFTVGGMFHGRSSLAIEHLLDHAVVDSDGRLLVAMIDVLALARLDADAELLLVQFHDGVVRALRLLDIVDGDELFLQLEVPEEPGSGDEAWSACLWSLDVGPSSPVESIHAMSFASFVRQP